MMVLLAALLSSCGRKPATAMPDKGSDSIYTRDFIYQISKSNPERALALIDTAEMLNLLRTDHSSPDIMKSAIYYNGFRQPKLARHYALKAYEDAELRKDTIAYMTNLVNLVAASQDTDDFEGTIRYATEGIEIIQRSGKFKGEEGKLLMHIAMSQHALGMDKEAKANMMRSIDICKKTVDNDPCWSNVQNLFYTMGETMNELDEMGDYQQAAAMIPDLLKTNALHESLESEAPEGIIDMYRLYTFSQCMEIYRHLGNRKLADEYYQKCLTTEFAKSPEGLNFLIRYQLWIKEYQLALHNIQIIKQAFLQNQKSETAVNTLLGKEVDALTLLGRYKEATDVSREIIALKDTLFKRQQRDDAQELAVIYETGEKEAQLARQSVQLRENRMILLFAVCIIGLLGLLLWHNHRHSGIIRQKNKAMAGTITELLKYKEELYRCKDDNRLLREQLRAEEEALRQQGKAEDLQPESEAAPNETVADETVTDETAAEDTAPELSLLFERVEHEIISGQLFLRPQLSRDELIKLLRIPKNKFAPLFKQNTGLKYTQYFNKLKMEYAAKLLQEQPDYSVDAIGQSCGISSGSTFYRLFYETYGMTPIDFRKSVKITDNKVNTSAIGDKNGIVK